MGEWMDPGLAIADLAFDEGARVDARLRDGSTTTINFGYVEDECGHAWRAFYDDDGEEVFLSDIMVVRASPARDMQEVGG